MTTLHTLAGLAVIAAVLCAVIRATYLELARKCPRCGANDISSINLCESRCNQCGREWRLG